MTPYICINCKFLDKNLKCKAFPKGIPKEILLGENDHSKPLPNQENNIIFEPINEQEQ
jgi:hypothetical protein